MYVCVCVEGGRLARRSHSVFTCHLASEHLPDPRTIYEPEQPHAPAAETASSLLILFCVIFLFVFVAHMYKNSPLHMRLRLNYTHIFRPLIFDSVVTLSPLSRLGGASGTGAPHTDVTVQGLEPSVVAQARVVTARAANVCVARGQRETARAETPSISTLKAKPTESAS